MQIDQWIIEDRQKQKRNGETKVVLLTGGTSGIGTEIALALASANYQLILLARNEELAMNVVKDLKIQSKNSEISFVKCELDSLESVRQAAKEILKKKVKLDILINNAGVFETKYKTTQDGVEMNFGVNHLSHFLLTNLLMLSMRENATIINVSSVAHYAENYAVSKLANVLFTISLADRFPKMKSIYLLLTIVVYSVHPGSIRSQLYRSDPIMARLINSAVFKLLPFALLSPIEGALTPIYLALEAPNESGKYFGNLRSQPMNPYATKEEAEKLWDKSCDLVGQSFK